MLITLIGINEELKAMKELEISFEQLTFIKLLHADIESSFISESESKYVYGYYNYCLQENIKLSFIAELVNRGFVTIHPNKLKPGNVIVVNDLTISSELRERLWVQSNEAGFELLSAYPESLEINGKVFSLRTFSENRNIIFELYAKSISFNKEVHKRILEETIIAKDNGVLNTSFQKFIYSQPWTFEGWNKKKDEGSVASFNVMDMIDGL